MIGENFLIEINHIRHSLWEQTLLFVKEHFKASFCGVFLVHKNQILAALPNVDSLESCWQLAVVTICSSTLRSGGSHDLPKRKNLLINNETKVYTVILRFRNPIRKEQMIERILSGRILL
jgi:hypothetical protein